MARKYVLLLANGGQVVVIAERKCTWPRSSRHVYPTNRTLSATTTTPLFIPLSPNNTVP